MAASKFLARDLTIQVEDVTPNDWIAIDGLNSLTHSPSISRADTTDFGSNGRAEHIVSQRAESWALAGFTIIDVGSGERDAGQARCEVLGLARGLGALGRFKITDPGGNTITFDGSCEVTLHGGGHNDPAAWKCGIEVSGEPDFAGPELSS